MSNKDVSEIHLSFSEGNIVFASPLPSTGTAGFFGFSIDMRLTFFTDYTLRVLIYLGTHSSAKRLSTISDIASAYGIRKNHLMKIVHHLALQGYVETTRGNGGGMRLARPPGEIRIGDVVRSTGEAQPIVDCSDCPLRSACSLRGILSCAMGAFFNVLDQRTLVDLLPPHEGTPAATRAGVNDPSDRTSRAPRGKKIPQ